MKVFSQVVVIVTALLLFISYVNAQEEPLNIWLVAHSHDDTGWLRTVDEYYIYEVQYILDTVMESLSQNPNRKFIQVEMAFFYRWWREQSESVKQKTRTLVENGQLEFINGGWCMNDEAVPIYYASIDQMTLGHEFLNAAFGEIAKPKIGWHIDPFGHSNVMSSLYQLTGFDAFFINRIDYREKSDMKSTGDLEFIWQGSKNRGEKSKIWTHMMDEHYCTPNGFNWEHGVTQDLPQGDGPPPMVINPPSFVTSRNDFERAQEFVTEAKRRAQAFKTNNILIPFGCDFTFQNANMMFKNMDRIIDAINQYTELGATARYTSLSDYVEHVSNLNSSWITREKDFFPYADGGDSYWTGYFTSRPTVKSVSRMAHGVLRNADFLFSLTNIEYGFSKFETWTDLLKLRAPEAVVQHHDGVTGTFRQLVGEDYLNLLSHGVKFGYNVINDMIGTLVSDSSFDPELTCFTTYLHEQLAAGETVPVAVFNSLGWAKKTYVNITLLDSNVVVTDFDGNEVPFQVNPHVDDESFTLFFLVDLPPVGFATYKISSQKNLKNVGKFVTLEENSVVENEYFSLTYSNSTGLLSSYLNKRNSVVTQVSQNYFMYTSYNSHQSSGAYILRPTGPATAVTQTTKTTVITGPYVTEVHQIFKDGVISQVSRVYTGLDSIGGRKIEISAKIGPLGWDQEVVSRFVTNIANNNIFYTDNNGLELQERINLPDGRPGDHDDGVRIGGNYYPAVSRAIIQNTNNNVQLAVVTQSTQGAASLSNGQLEIMLHRRCSRDDARGIGQAMDDQSVYDALFSFAIDEVNESVRYHQRTSKDLAFPVSVSFGNPSLASQWKRTSHQFLKNSLPENVHMVSLNSRDSTANSIAIRLLHTFELNSHPTLSQPVTVNLLDLFTDMTVSDVEERTLTLMHTLEPQPDPKQITLNSMDIRTFVISLNKNE